MESASNNPAIDFWNHRLKNREDQEFRVRCGDWIYPSRDSTTGTKYPIAFPLVANLFMQSSERERPVSSQSRIDFHLDSPRSVVVEFLDNGKAIHMKRLVNEKEEDFSRQLNFFLEYDIHKLARWEEIRHSHGAHGDKWWPSIWLMSALLNAYTSNMDLPDGVTFRRATIPEIESLGSW
ncbi:MAG: hypothetical protein KBC62_01560 [Candidatus Pacebacteria bacterium]|nr:hypothetical protein [Candidatus Paceibacterota bacterium]